MSDLISRQDTIDALHMHLMYRMGTDSNKKRLDDWINGVPSAQPEPHWIPCGERLPEEKQSVLVTDGSVIWVCDIINTDEGYKWEDSHGYWLDLDEWIAWMSLPKFYNGGGDTE